MTSSWDMLWVLLVLLLMIGGIVMLLRFVGRRNRGWWVNRSMRSLGGLTLGTNKSMQIVEWNNRIYVLGVGENVQLLESITDPELVAALIAQYDHADASAKSPVPPWLKQWLEPQKRQCRSFPASPSEVPIRAALNKRWKNACVSCPSASSRSIACCRTAGQRIGRKSHETQINV